jgi:hypothetical protein
MIVIELGLRERVREIRESHPAMMPSQSLPKKRE